ncbi:MAG: hypothetical protein HY825_16840 [Acidobacteria bacterium]|nr:hypothetical protein [Acidobacteriota bacterium]
MRGLIGIVAAVAVLGPSVGCQDDAGSGVTAINLSTGETREYPDEESVPDGWAPCPEGDCPDPYDCTALDETTCAVRPDCFPVYIEAWPRECESPEPPEFCAGLPFAGCDGARCIPEDCGPLPPPGMPCPDGTLPAPDCVRNLDGACGWEPTCPPPPPICAPEECGPMPMAAVRCPDGSTADTVCDPGPDGVCGWHFVCPTLPLCPPEECGPALGMPAYVCADGSLGGNTGRCLRDPATGTCGWEIRDCPPGCEPEACGPMPGMPTVLCEDGSVGGFTGRCLPGPDGACGWEILECPPACTPETCGPLPEIAMICPDGSTAEPVCGHDPTGLCGWTFVCGPPPVCDPVACGPMPGMASWICADGTLGGFTGNCLPDPTTGACGWEFRDCPAECRPELCGPPLGMPNYECPDGSLGGPTGRCLSGPDGACGWEVRDCPLDCSPEECGPAPAPEPCPGGATGAAACLRDPSTGTCGWWFGC